MHAPRPSLARTASLRRLTCASALLALGAGVAACSTGEPAATLVQDPAAAWSSCQIGYVIDPSALAATGLDPEQVDHQVALLTRAITSVPGYALQDQGVERLVVGKPDTDDPMLVPSDERGSEDSDGYIPAGILIKFARPAVDGWPADPGHPTGYGSPTMSGGRISSADVLIDATSVAESARTRPDRPLRLYRHVLGHAFGLADTSDGTVMDSGKSGLDDVPGGLEGVGMRARQAGCG
jgi:hypothetical protein